ncbi:cbb3-type cytochrome c oxidase subunit I [Halolamina sp. C58]|uniref:cbb3-type cytochrome c oxidase subunit I n=1 Tax=Halolamina sp. C58 TaxID=3421640 RepID=UPI003EBC9FAE
MTDDTQPRTDGGTALPGDSHDDSHLPPRWSLKRWLVTTNHKDVGILYLATAMFFLIFGGVLALLIRAQMWTPRAPGEGILSAMAYNQAVSLHGLIMVFWFISPFATGFANYVVPLQIGAEDLAFPRLNALSYWLYLASGILVFASFFQGASYAGGWTLYAPLNIPAFMPSIGATTTVLAIVVFCASVTVGGVNFITTIHRMRAPGLTMRSLPLFTWSWLLTVWMMLLAFAALLAAAMILLSDRMLGTTYFAATTAGGSVLWTHLFWFFGHPEVYIVFFPALGAMAEIFQTFSGNRIVGRKWFIVSMVLVALQSFIVWMHHMFLTSINLEVKTLFMATTIGISLPFDLMVFALIYTLIKGRIRWDTPMLYAFGALVLFIVGGITGVFLGAVVLDYEFRGTYWVVAHFHYVMVSGVTGLIAGLFYWFPKITGKTYDEFLGKVSFAVYFTGFNLLYFPLFLAWGTPRRVFAYRPEYLPWHRLASVGAVILGISFLLIIYNLAKSIVAGDDAAANPWPYSTTAEWAVSSPPPMENFPGTPSYASGSLEFLRDDEPTGAAAADGGTTATDGGHAAALESAHDDGGHVDHASYWPFAIGLFTVVTAIGFSGLQTGSFPAGLEGTFYAAASVLGVLGLIGSVSFMGYENFTAHEGGFGETWPFGGVENTKMGMWVFLASDVVLFGAFIGAAIFLRVAYGWTQWHPIPHNPIPGLVNTYLLLTSSFTVILSLVAAQKRSRKGVVASLVVTFLLGLAFLVNKAIEWVVLFQGTEEYAPIALDSSVRASTYFLTTGLHMGHVIAGLLVTAYLIWRAWNGAYVNGDDEPLEYFGLYWHFVDIVWLFLFPMFYII